MLQPVWTLVLAAAALAQSPDSGNIVRHGATATLSIDAARPLHAALALVENYGIEVNAEDPPYLYPGDLRYLTIASPEGDSNIRVLAPKGGRLEVSYPVSPDGRPLDIDGLIGRIVETYNRDFPFRYRLDRSHGAYTFIPVAARDGEGNLRPIAPLLDLDISIPVGYRGTEDALDMVGERLSAQVPVHIACCGSRANALVLHRRWSKPQPAMQGEAREVMAGLLRSAPIRYHWLVRYDPANSGWVIDVESVPPAPSRQR
jgi:hypothetical protein